MVQWSNMTATILITEDEEFLASILNSKLIKAGYKTVKAKDGDEAIRFAIETKPDLILLDVMMPKMNGFEMLKGLKNNQQTKNTPVILLTNVGEENANQGLDLGAVAYLVKAHYDVKDIVKKVKEILNAYIHELPKVEVEILSLEEEKDSKPKKKAQEELLKAQKKLAAVT